jgi:hypothetical protein
VQSVIRNRSQPTATAVSHLRGSVAVYKRPALPCPHCCVRTAHCCVALCDLTRGFLQNAHPRDRRVHSPLTYALRPRTMSPPGVQVQRVLRAARPAGSGTSGPGAGPPGFSLCAADGVELDDVEEPGAPGGVHMLLHIAERVCVETNSRNYT